MVFTMNEVIMVNLTFTTLDIRYQHKLRLLDNTSKIILCVFCLILSFIGCGLKVMFFRFLVQRPRLRPVDRLMLIDQTVTFGMIPGTYHLIACILSPRPLSEVLGEKYCFGVSSFLLFCSTYFRYASFGVTLLRMLYIKAQHFVQKRIGELRILYYITFAGELKKQENQRFREKQQAAFF